ncbi:GH1 family beta-glucosidase [Streptomyces winkii]|uniref:GH1 family beta-glucosidase n=1 Tax=Streptomyces winkii TaxID=3051178 RepID=UPI0028D7944C|nr:GH1 family beta-glucosidase [Streptomyces sp. DSM 40971]
MPSNCVERTDGGAGRSGGLLLRHGEDGGVAEVPYVAALLTDDGRCLPVPVQESDDHDDGSTTVRGEAHGFAARLRLAPPDGTGRGAELTVRRTAETAARAGLRAELRLGALAEDGDPGWLIPGVFYGQNRLPGCTRLYPRYEAGTCDVPAMTADAWSFRADRCATPAVFARDGAGGAALVLAAECGGLGENGVGFALLPGARPALRLHAPYREEPLSYYGSSEPLPARTPTHLWRTGEVHTLAFTVHLLDADPHAYAPVLRDLHQRRLPDVRGEAGAGPAAWAGLEETAELAAYGLHRWHYRPDPPVLLETAAFDREALGERGDRQAMHVSWISGVPYAHALLLHARRTGDEEKAAAALAVLDHIAGNLTPGGTFWGQWTREQGWNVGWHSDRRRLHSRTLGDAALFLLRALVAERSYGTDHPDWEHAVRSNLAAAVAGQDAATGRLPAALDSGTGGAVDHEGGAGLSWIAPLVEAAGVLGEPDLLRAARRAGARHAADVRAEFLCGAPEDVSLAPTSEDGYNALIAYTLLHEADPGDRRWLDLARRAADWTLTFRYTYDVRFDEDTLLGRYGFRTRGADQASPSNQHLHAFGLICLPETVRLARHLGDPYYLRSARENLDCFRQFVARRDGDFNAYRGMVSERFYQTECFQAKGMLLTLSHAWSAGVLLYACEAARGLPELKEQQQEQQQEQDGDVAVEGGAEGTVLRFPEGFRWGTATSAYQVEGATDADGRGESIWDRFCRVPGAVENGDTGDVACDMYRRALDDVGLMAELGTNAHRFSLAWPRIVPRGTGRVEPRGLAHYDRFIDALLARGISPLVTLYHWDLPQPLQERGGWRARETAEAFAEYAAVCFEAFGDRVRDWVTVNEPWIAGLLGHQLGLHAPGERDLAGSVRAMHHLLLGHGLAAAQAPGDARTGVAHALFPHTPADPGSAADRAAARASDGYVNRWFLDAVHGRGYPDDMRRHWERAAGELDFVRDGDLETIGARSDFIGVNYYTRRIVSARAGSAAEGADGPWPWKVEPGRPGVPRTDLDWEVVPDELTALLLRLHHDHPGVPLLITENGGVFDDGPGADGAVQDERRVRFLRAHLTAVHRALAAGAPVEGYYHWSLIDNFEWAMGYRPRFGLVHLDRDTQRRTVKDSGHWYARVARSGTLTGAPSNPPH